MKKTLILISIIFFLSLFVRVAYVNDGLFHHDSVQLAKAVSGTVESGELHPAVNNKYFCVFIYSLIYHLVGFFGVSIYASVTYSTIFFASLAMVMIFLFVKELWDNEVIAVSAALLYSFNPLFLSVTTYAKSHGFAVFMVMLSLYLLVKFLKSNTYLYGALFVITYVLSLASRPSNILVFPIILLLFFLPHKIINGNVDSFFSFNKAVILFSSIIGIMLIYFFGIISPISHIDLPSSNLDSMFKLMFLVFLSLPTALTIPLLFILVVSVYLMIFKKKDWNLFFLLFWFFCVFLPISITSTVAPRYYVSALIPLCILAGYGIFIIRENFRTFSNLLLVSLIVFSLFTIVPVLEYRHNYSGPKEFGIYIREVTEENAIILIGDYAPYIKFYGNRSTLIYEEDVLGIIDDYLNEGIPIYVPFHIINKSDFNISKHFNLTFVGEVFNEEFHKSALIKKGFVDKIYRVEK